MISQSEINQICQKESLIFEKIIRTSDRFVLVLGKENNRDIVLKILRNPRRTFTKIALKKEAAALNFFNKIKNPNLKVPQLLKTSFLGKYPYYKEEFIKGETLEAKEGFFFKKLDKKEIKQLSDMVSFLNKVDNSKIKKSVLKLSNFGNFYFDFALKWHRKEIVFFLKKEKIEKLFNLIKKAKEILTPRNLAVVHGEIYPNNLMEDKKGRIFLLDWENIGLGNLGHDAASVYLRLKDEYLSQFFLKNLNLSKQKFFQYFFTIEIVLQSIGSLSHFNEVKTISKKFKKEARIHFLKKINQFLI